MRDAQVAAARVPIKLYAKKLDGIAVEMMPDVNAR